MRDSLKAAVRLRLLSVVVLACLSVFSGVQPCLAMLLAPKDEHACCDEERRRGHEQGSSCELLCVLRAFPTTLPDKSAPPQPQIDSTGVRLPELGPAPVVPFAACQQDLAPRGERPPLYLLTGSLLI